ncbi:serine protease [Candidatus Pelagibacter bacterium]|nr:serine protease [Candidatus Pelagibacter bacterium]
MKKILSIVVVSFLLCNLGVADIIFKNCLSVLPVGDNEYVDGKFIPSKTEKVIKLKDDERREFYVSFDESAVYKTRVITKNWKRISGNNRVENAKYIITFIDEKIILAKGKNFWDDKGNFTTDEVEIDLDNNEIIIDIKGETLVTKKLVEVMKITQGNSSEIFRCKRENFDEKDNDEGGSSGTAFFINKKGYLLTNNHVVEGCTLSKISYKNNDYDTKLIATDRTLDLALLKSELKPKTFINFSDKDVKKLDTIYVAGYPLGIEGLSDDLKMNPGVVSSLKGFDNNSNEIQIDAAINSGNSGGPIINENGDLIAITVSGMAKDQTEGINFGIKSSAAERFLKSNNINFNKSLNSRSKNKEQLRNILEEGTVYTYCN